MSAAPFRVQNLAPGCSQGPHDSWVPGILFVLASRAVCLTLPVGLPRLCLGLSAHSQLPSLPDCSRRQLVVMLNQMALRIVSSLLLVGTRLHIAVAQDTSPGGPVHDGQPDNCNAWHTIVDGDTCATVPELYGISRDQFLEWNPAVSDDCVENFWLGNAYCVGVGERATTSSSPVTSITSTSEPITTSTTTSQNLTYSTREPIVTWNITIPTTDTAWPPTATQSGQPAACDRWHLVSPGQTCDNIINKYGRFMTFEQL